MEESRSGDEFRAISKRKLSDVKLLELSVPLEHTILYYISLLPKMKSELPSLYFIHMYGAQISFRICIE